MGEADWRALGWMGGVDLLVEPLKGVGHLWILSGHLIRDQPEDWGSLSWSRHPWSVL